MEKSMAEGSCSFEEALARMIGDGSISREEGLANSDSVTNLIWRLQNEPGSAPRTAARKPQGDDDVPEYTDFIVDVVPDGFVPRRAGAFPTLNP